MMKIYIKRINKRVETIIIEGHAGYDKYGKDIVCAAASSSVLTTVNAILKIDEDSLEYLDKKDKIIINLKKHDQIVDKLIDNLVSMLNELEEDYKKYIKIIEEVL